MELNKEEELALAGEYGEGMSIAMSLLVDIGDFYHADKLININSAHISGVSYLTGGDGLIDQLTHFLNSGAKVRVFSTLNPCGMDRDNWQSHYVSPNFSDKQFQILNIFEKLGVQTTCSCTPYDFGHLLLKGEHVAWAESSAITFANSFFGARTNKEDSLSVLASAITGKTNNYGFHLTKHRIPNVKVQIEAKLEEYSDFSIAGEVIGKALSNNSFQFGPIPHIFGIKKIRPFEIKSLSAALASFGIHLFHIDGITPEKELYDNFPKNAYSDELVVTQKIVDDTFSNFSPPHIPSLAVIGCPNACIEEMINLAGLVSGKKLKKNKELWVFTNRAQKETAKSIGVLDTLKQAGIKVLVDTCPEVTPYDKIKFTSILTNSIKAQHYISGPSLNGIPTYVLPLKNCVEVMLE